MGARDGEGDGRGGVPLVDGRDADDEEQQSGADSKSRDLLDERPGSWSVSTRRGDERRGTHSISSANGLFLPASLPVRFAI